MPAPLALYIHWPFCLSKCPYCDFNSHVREKIPEERFVAALRAELRHEAARLGPRVLTSIFFGGGTPSLMSAASIATLIDEAAQNFSFLPGMEITLEANPTSVELAKLQGFAAAGVNRLSMGVQALNDAALKSLGRQHSAAEAIAAFTLARKIFPRFSFDLIYARPGQQLIEWRDELHRALDFGGDHLSLYQLTIEPGTAFEARARKGEIMLPDPELAAEMYRMTAVEAAKYGLLGYEISNYAKPGFESRHNLAYWRYQEYLGIGPGAHGRVLLDGTLHATRRHRAPEPWAELVENNGTGTTEEEPLDPHTRAREALLMGLRLTEGVQAAAFLARTGVALAEAIEAGFVKTCVEEGYLAYSDECLRVTALGLPLLDAILPRLVR
jgi:oxygen-independent coproporphyrinogen-3 oxidase